MKAALTHMTLLSDTSVNLSNINADLIALTKAIDSVTSSNEGILDAIVGPSDRPTKPVPSNSASVSMLMALYASIKQLEALANRLQSTSAELDGAINGTPVKSNPQVLVPSTSGSGGLNGTDSKSSTTGSTTGAGF